MYLVQYLTQYNMGKTNLYSRDKSVSSVSMANAAKHVVGKPRGLAETVCFKCGKRGHMRAKCLSNAVQGSNKSMNMRKKLVADFVAACRSLGLMNMHVSQNASINRYDAH